MNDAYKPPTALVADPPPVKLPRRPWSIAIALLFIGLAIVDAGSRLGRGDMVDAGLRIGWIVTLVFIAWMIGRQRNWARWVLLGITAWNALGLVLMLVFPNAPEGVHLDYDYSAVAWQVAAVLCLVVATLLVFVPGRAWFEGRR